MITLVDISAPKKKYLPDTLPAPRPLPSWRPPLLGFASDSPFRLPEQKKIENIRNVNCRYVITMGTLRILIGMPSKHNNSYESFGMRRAHHHSYIGDENWTQSFFSQTFWPPPGYPAKNPRMSRQKVWFPWASKDLPSFLAPTPSRGRPPPHPKISGPKSLGLGSFFLPDYRMISLGAQISILDVI